MSLFDNLFGRKRSASAPATAGPMKPAALPPERASEVPSKDPNLIQVFDAYGRELFISKEQWRTGVLPGTLKSHWQNADQLYGVIFGALNDGFLRTYCRQPSSFSALITFRREAPAFTQSC